MKGKYFFKDTNGTFVEIQEFDYEYVRNSLLKVFDKNVAKKYIFNVVVRRIYDSAGMPIFDVRPLNLDDIYYDNTRLRVFEMMLDEIYFGRVSIKDLPTPRIQQEYQEFLEGRSKAVAQVEQPTIPAPITFTRTEIQVNDERIAVIKNIESSVPVVPMKALDWVDNFEVCSQEMTQSTQKLSEEQIRLVNVLKTNSDYIHGVFSNLTTVLEKMFPLKPTLSQRIFGKKDIEVKQDELGTILSTLRNAVAIDTERFSGISEVFKQIQNNISEIKDSVEQGVIGCKYVIQTVEDAYEFELRQERLMKIRATTEISELSLTTVNKTFISDLNKLKEVQEVVVPLLIIKLQNQATKKVDDETVGIIRNLAYRDTSTSENKPLDPPKKP